MKSLILTILISITGLANASILDTARCAQDIADYKHGNSEGLEFAASILDRLLLSPEDSKNLASQCRAYLEKTPRWKLSRKSQLADLQGMKNFIHPQSYFFLRSAIRPLIVCEKDPSPLHRTCLSTTGKSWYETGFHPASRQSEFLYRLGHSETPGGILVLGPQDEFTAEDKEFIRSLPGDFTRTAIEDLSAELSTKSYRMKIYMLERMTRFMEHYFTP